MRPKRRPKRKSFFSAAGFFCAVAVLLLAGSIGYSLGQRLAERHGGGDLATSAAAFGSLPWAEWLPGADTSPTDRAPGTDADPANRLPGTDTSPADQSPGTWPQDAVAAFPFTLHFLDVGQADCLLALSGGQSLLIDAGNAADGDAIIQYLRAQGINQLDYVIATHPHEDHIGGLPAVLRAFPADTLIMPPKAHTTRIFEDALLAIEESSLAVTLPNPGDIYPLGEASFTILGPVGEYGEQLNNWSVGILLTVGERRFLLCGDAEAQAEQDMLDAYPGELWADVLKLSHHGSDTSSTAVFLDQAAPVFAVLSCGDGNLYGHPHEKTMSALRQREISLFRTDKQGTVIVGSDGRGLYWNASPTEDYSPGAGQASDRE